VVVLLIPPNHGEASGLRVELMAREREQADAWMREVRTAMDRLNAYRGKVIAFGGAHPFRPAPLEVRRLPEVPREAIVLPDGTLERIERHTVGLSQHKEVLRAQGRHVKRGLLLHGPPGTGKTLTVMYLASLMPDRTTLLLTGGALQLLGPGVALARSMEPATIVIEDVDLVALDRSHVTQNPLLFELLNAMDGLDDDADLIFVLAATPASSCAAPPSAPPRRAHRWGHLTCSPRWRSSATQGAGSRRLCWAPNGHRRWPSPRTRRSSSASRTTWARCKGAAALRGPENLVRRARWQAGPRVHREADPAGPRSPARQVVAPSTGTSTGTSASLEPRAAAAKPPPLRRFR
jgi:hypothetical protein